MIISPELRKMVSYKPGKPISEAKREFGLEKVIKLASNENPLGVSPLALKAIEQALTEQNLYPDPTHYELISALSSAWKISRECISIGNGSDELIDLLTRIMCEPGESMVTSQAAFAAYSVSAQANRVKTVFVPQTPDFRFDLGAIANKVENDSQSKIKIVFIANPNNPTGTYNSRNEVESFLSRIGGREDVLIVFDEAYVEFVRASDYSPAQNYLQKYPNLAVLRTFSKVYGMAGLRVGALLASPELVEIYNRVRKPFNCNSLAQVAATAAIKDQQFIEASRILTWKGLDYFYAKLEELGLPFYHSQGNFVMFDTLRDARVVYDALLRKGIIMRPLVNYGFPTHLRLSVGLMEENQAAMTALEQVLQQIPLGK